MTQIVTRLYATKKAADNAVAALTKKGFNSSHIHVTNPPRAAAGEGNEAHHGHDAIVKSIVAGRVHPSEAEIYAQGVARGGTLVSVDAPFGTAALAISTLDGFGPIESGVKESYRSAAIERDDAAPFSSALGWKTLSHEAAPFSKAMGWKLLTAEPAPFAKKTGMSEKSHKAAPLSDALGLPTLSHDAAPFSRLLGMSTLAGKAAPFSSMFGWPTLSDKAAPFSEKLGMRTLSENPAPLSDAIGLPVLSDSDSQK